MMFFFFPFSVLFHFICESITITLHHWTIYPRWILVTGCIPFLQGHFDVININNFITCDLLLDYLEFLGEYYEILFDHLVDNFSDN